jgi:hypothetical protein
MNCCFRTWFLIGLKYSNGTVTAQVSCSSKFFTAEIAEHAESAVTLEKQHEVFDN